MWQVTRHNGHITAGINKPQSNQIKHGYEREGGSPHPCRDLTVWIWGHWSVLVVLEEWLDSTSEGFSNFKFYGSIPELALLPPLCHIQMQLVSYKLIKQVLPARQHPNTL